jgi:hypothetical protein
LREFYGTWHDEPGSQVFEFGRINLRNGPAYGFNPTDYFRSGALRVVTTADPIALRESRMGTVVARYQRLWTDGGMSVAVAPRIQGSPSAGDFSADFGATNAHARALATWSGKPTENLSGQLLAYAEEGGTAQLGASATILLSDSVVGYTELSSGRDTDRFAAAAWAMDRKIGRTRLSAGGTYTTPFRTSLTIEYEFNGFAPSGRAFGTWAAANPLGYFNYLRAAAGAQDGGSRQAWLIYVKQQGAYWKNLEFTALCHLNADDRSRLTWLEFRYHWPRFDAAMQWQATRGTALSEFGIGPYARSFGLLGAWYF